MPHTQHLGHLWASDKPPALLLSQSEIQRPPVAVVCVMLWTVGVVGLLVTLGLFGGCGLGTAAAGGTSGPDDRPATLAVGPEDGPAVLEAVRAARRRVWMEMYMLTAPEVVAALIAAHDAGVEVRVLLEPTPYGEADANLPAFGALAAAGVDVRWTTRAIGLAHLKLVVIDDRAAIVTTANGTVAGLGLNREFSVVDTDALDVRWAQAVWTADAVGADPGAPPPRTRLVTAPIDARARLTAALESALVSIWLEMEELSDADVVSRLLRAQQRGVAITVVAPAGDTSGATAAALRTLTSGGVVVRLLAAPAVHAKAMVVDRRLVYVGSVNFTRASFDDNREVGLLLDAPDVVARVAATIAADAAAGRPP